MTVFTAGLLFHKLHIDSARFLWQSLVKIGDISVGLQVLLNCGAAVPPASMCVPVLY